MFYKLWRWLFGGCEHKWILEDEISVYDKLPIGLPYATKYILQCEKCGNLKKKVV